MRFSHPKIFAISLSAALSLLGQINQGQAQAEPSPNALAPLVVTSLADTVDATDGVVTLREAIDTANRRPGADVISFAPELSGTIKLSGTQLVIQDDLTLEGGASNAIAISGEGASRIFQINTEIAANLNNLTLLNGVARSSKEVEPPPDEQVGGAIRSMGSLTLNHCKFSNNTAEFGGAVFSRDSIFNVYNSEFTNNRAKSEGALWSTNQLLQVTNSRFKGQLANLAGAIYTSTPKITVANSSFEENAAQGGGGGMYVVYSPLLGSVEMIITNSNFLNNKVARDAQGGGLYVAHRRPADQRASSVMLLSNTTFLGNGIKAGEFATNAQGGGVYLERITAQIVNSTFSANSADYGGAIAAYGDGELRISNSTIARNSAQSGGGIWNSNYGLVQMSGSIIAQNGTNRPQEFSDLAGRFTSQGYNLIGDRGNALIYPSGADRDQVGVDPKLDAPKDNGGPNWTMALLAGSPAIDAIPSDSAPSTDQRGIPRRNGFADMGAVEYGRRPIAQNDSGTLAAGGSIDLAVLSNDRDEDGTPLTIASTTNPAHGTLRQNSNGTLTYTANPDFVGVDSFTYLARDGIDGNSQPATVKITVTPPNFEGTRGADTLTGTDADDRMNGKAGNDVIDGKGGNDIVNGDSENDTLYGGAGEDTLNGGSQDDGLIGGQGKDFLIGGTGNDRYVYTALDEAGDTIQDFMNGNDVLDLRELFRNLKYQGTDAIADGYLRLVSNAGKTEVQIDPDGSSSAGFTTLVTLNGITPKQLIIGQNLLIR